ncbi:type II toxin-antitoxin system RelE/ParE family toxin [Roseateles sp.]|uniref:type II toxin-antitoxin system RelE/ParE family toxin n=1 Tax=Roseateles sp. TaxID=1971397 RepID=UPI0031CE4008
MLARRSLEWSPRARRSYDNFLDELAEKNALAALEFNDDVLEKLSLIQVYPKLYRESTRVVGVREMVIRPNFFIVYRVLRTKLRILNFEHSRRNWPQPPSRTSPRRRR